MANRVPSTPTRPDYQQLANRAAIPVIVTDYRFTRRERLHVLYIPGDPVHLSDQRLHALLAMAAMGPWSQCILATGDDMPTPRLWYCGLRHPPTEDHPHG